MADPDWICMPDASQTDADGWTISDEHPTRVIIRPSSAAVTVTVTHNDRIDRWTLRVTVFNLQLKPVLLARRARLRAPGRGHAGLLLQRRMNCLFITARGRKIRNSEPGGGGFQWAPTPNPLPPRGRGGADIVTILPCAVATVSTSTYVTEQYELFFSTFPRRRPHTKGLVKPA